MVQIPTKKVLDTNRKITYNTEMNEYNTTFTTLFNDLNRLCAENEAFYFNDWELDGTIYRNFNYRLASYTDFLEPGALECRGIMFEIINPDAGFGALEGYVQPLRLASLPFEKFFNLNENPMTMDLDLSTIVEITDKADGSLITTYMHNDVLRVKTKGSLSSDQAVAAKLWLLKNENVDFRNELIQIEKTGCTVIMEWCAPDNRIVLPYMEPHLKVLGIRDRIDGSYQTACHDTEPEIYARWTKIIKTDDPEAYINSVTDMQGVEGVVFELPSGQHVKCKSSWYLALHHTKDSINTPRRLYEAVLEEATDDMRSLFHDDPLAIKLIGEMEEFVEVRYNHLVDVVERFYEQNKELDRKSYAILGQNELKKLQFGLAMQKYLERDFSYKEVMKKRWKEFGLKDEKVIEEE